MSRWKWGVVLGWGLLILLGTATEGGIGVAIAAGVTAAFGMFVLVILATLFYRLLISVGSHVARPPPIAPPPAAGSEAPNDDSESAKRDSDGPTRSEPPLTSPCLACGTTIATHVVRCPSCAYEPKLRGARARFWAVLLGFLLMLTGAGAIIGIPLILLSTLGSWFARKQKPTNTPVGTI